MKSQALNFLWLNLDLPAPSDPEDGSIREPMPVNYIENIRKAGAVHPSAQIILWVDSKRLTERQMSYLRRSIEEGLPNVRLSNLRDIPEYNQEPLYNEGETSSEWRDNQLSLIWRQLDAAKILITLQGNFDQVFFADLDLSNFGMNELKVQRMMRKHGLFIGSGGKSILFVENQLWGFNPSRRMFFEKAYKAALRDAYRGGNGWGCLAAQVHADLQLLEHLPLKEFLLPLRRNDGSLRNDGSYATHPGHQWRDGEGEEVTPALIPSRTLSGIFNDKDAPVISNEKIAVGDQQRKNANRPVLTPEKAIPAARRPFASAQSR